MKQALLVLAALATPASAGTFLTGLSRGEPADCSELHETNTAVPWWSRLSWSVGGGVGTDGGKDPIGVVAVQGSVAPWLRERRCTPSSSILFKNHPWVRWSVAASGDAMWRDDGSHELRPALRFSRARMNAPLLFGSVWTPDSEWFATLGPTFASEWTGGGASLGYRVTALAVELRVNLLRERGTEGFVMFSFADLHGLTRIGPARTIPGAPKDRWRDRVRRML